MGILSLFKNINLGFGMPHMPAATSASTMEAKEYKEVEHDNKMSLAGDHNEITSVDKDKRFKNDEVSYHDLKRVFIGYPPKSSVPDCPYHLQTGFCTIGMDCKFNHPSREENVEGKLEEAVSGLRRLAKFKGDQGPDIASSENVGQIECKFYLLPGGCKYGNDCGFLHHVALNFLGLPMRPGEKKCPFYMRTGGCKFASCCKFHHPDPTAVVGHSFQDQKNGAPSPDHGPVEQLYETSRPSEKTSNEQTSYLGPFTPNRGLQQNVHWNGNQTVTSLLHPPEIKIFDQQQAFANKDAAYEFSGGMPQQFDEYPQRPGKPECQYFMKTGYCKFNSACRYHHPKSNLSSLSLPLTPARNNYERDGLVKQKCEIPLPSENSSNDQSNFLCLSSSNVPDLFTPNQGLQPNVQWNGDQTVKSLLHPPEIKNIDQQQAFANKDAAYEFSGGEPQQFDEYPQRPGKPECQYFMKTGYCKFNSACRYHHPKSNLSSLSLSLSPARNNYEQDGLVEQICEIPLPSENSSNDQSTLLCLSSSNVPDMFTPNQGLQPNVQWNGDEMATDPLHPPEMKMIEKNQELAYNDTAYEFNGDAKWQQFDEYPQRPGEPQCQHFMQSGYCKFKSACRSHHPKSNLSFLSPPPKPDKPICTYYSRRGICKFGSACRYNHHTDHT